MQTAQIAEGDEDEEGAEGAGTPGGATGGRVTTTTAGPRHRRRQGLNSASPFHDAPVASCNGGVAVCGYRGDHE